MVGTHRGSKRRTSTSFAISSIHLFESVLPTVSDVHSALQASVKANSYVVMFYLAQMMDNLQSYGPTMGTATSRCLKHTDGLSMRIMVRQTGKCVQRT